MQRYFRLLIVIAALAVPAAGYAMSSGCDCPDCPCDPCPCDL